ncbi:MAG: TonB-dependent receptor plug domain-containing protein [Bacteroidales bacterium]|nr:TonB-dependent receptor plug domain-containing protein [Bacteroidales bacterium]
MKLYIALLCAMAWCHVYSQNDTLFAIRDTVRLEEVVFSGQIPLNNTVLAKHYQKSGFSSIDKINSRLPGVSLIKRGGYAYEPQIHGFSAGQVNISIDGMRMFGACTDKMDPVTSYVEPSNLKRLDIKHNADAAEYGNLIGGSLDMQLQEPFLNQYHVLDFSVGSSYNTLSKGHNSLADINVSGARTAFRLNGAYRKHNSYRNGQGEEVPFSQYEKANLHLSALTMLSKGNSLKADMLADIAKDVGYASLPMDVGMARAKLASLEWRKYSVKGMFNNSQLKAYINSIYHLMDDSRRDSLFIVNNKQAAADSVFMRMHMPGWSNTYGAYFTTNLLWLKKNELKIKIENYYNLARGRK